MPTSMSLWNAIGKKQSFQTEPSIEAAVWADAFQPLPTGNLSYTYTNDDGQTASISLTVTQLEQYTWYGFFNNPADPVVASLAGKIFNSYLPDDFALQLMRIGDATINSQNQVNPTSNSRGPVFRSEVNMATLPTLISPNGSTLGLNPADPPIGETSNPIAGAVNFNVASGTTNWGNTGGLHGGAHSDFYGVNYPEIWSWWSQFLLSNSAFTVNKEQ